MLYAIFLDGIHVRVLLNRMNESAGKLSETLLMMTTGYQLHNHSSGREENVIFITAASSNSTTLTGFYQSFPFCVLPNVSAANISEPEKSYFPLFEFVISLVLLVVVALPGLVGNFISIFILSRPQMRTSLNVILIGTFVLFVY